MLRTHYRARQPLFYQQLLHSSVYIFAPDTFFPRFSAYPHAVVSFSSIYIFGGLATTALCGLLWGFWRCVLGVFYSSAVWGFFLSFQKVSLPASFLCVVYLNNTGCGFANLNETFPLRL